MTKHLEPPTDMQIVNDGHRREAWRFVTPSGVEGYVATEIPLRALALFERKLKRKLRDGERRRARRVLAGGE